jgi:regulator of ribonuclease activity A
MKTADVWDAFGETDQPGNIRVMAPVFHDFGGIPEFSGPAITIKVFEDNVLVRRALEAPGYGGVLVVDGGGSLRCALVGDQLAGLAMDNGWVGLVISGCIRDSADIAGMAIGVKALGTHPRKSVKRGHGVGDVPVEVGGVTVNPGDWIYADADGIIVSPEKLPE